MNKRTTEDALVKVAVACYQNESKYARWVYDAVKWYVLTDRASLDFVVALSRKNKRGMKTMVDKCLQGDLSTDGIIDTVKKVLEK